MTIKTRFYYHDKGNYFVYGGWLVMKKRQLVKLGNIPIETEGRPFFYDDTFYTIAYEHKSRKGAVNTNRIITEAAYTTSQREYLIKLNWFQQQKLLWMFRRQWLQQPGNMVHLIIIGVIMTLAIMGLEIITNRF